VRLEKGDRLKKRLKLTDVYVICTGAMFGSGFFLLPGIAAANAGPAVVVAYLISGLLIVPALVSQAELATAMPKAGGAYYFLDRTLGPMMGTIGGIGTWFALMLKSGFALIGMGAYIAIFFDVPFKPIAVGFAVVFAILNIMGSKEASGLVRLLVFALFTMLAFFLVDGLRTVILNGVAATHQTRFTPFLPEGIDGLLGTVGLVFISYVGLTKVASLAEEVEDADRNIPLGMTLSLVTVTCVYVVGVYVMVAVLGIDDLSQSLTPVADTAGLLFQWLPPRAGVFIVVAAAVAAFASMANTGIMAASRYPLAMARDRLMPKRFAKLGRFNSPTASIVLTTTFLVAFLLVLDVEGVAKLASALQLALFGLINIAVIVMRESRIESYDPGFRSPLYPWMQIAGIMGPLILIAEMGWLPALFTIGVVSASVGWYTYYARGHLARDGAIYHVFERLGRRRFAGLDTELRDIMKEKGARATDPFDEVVTGALTIDIDTQISLRGIIGDASDRLEKRLPATADQLVDGFTRGVNAGVTPVSRGAALLHMRLPDFDGSELVIARCAASLLIDIDDVALQRQAAEHQIRAVFFLVSGEHDAGRHLRILAQLAGRIETDGFMVEWLADRNDQELKETLLRDDRFLSLQVASGEKTEVLIGRALNELKMPEGSLIALIRRYGETLVPRGRTVLRDGDRLTIIGSPGSISAVSARYSDPSIT
jgi:APA family basic amino acid/polyamine antiporter